jgi:hypothetical protein
VRTALSVIAAAAAVLVAPAVPADAVPKCTDMAMNTRICTTPGHTAISSTPNPAFTNPYPGWGFGTLAVPSFGLGGGGFWVGF